MTTAPPQLRPRPCRRAHGSASRHLRVRRVTHCIVMGALATLLTGDWFATVATCSSAPTCIVHLTSCRAIVWLSAAGGSRPSWWWTVAWAVPAHHPRRVHYDGWVRAAARPCEFTPLPRPHGPSLGAPAGGGGAAGTLSIEGTCVLDPRGRQIFYNAPLCGGLCCDWWLLRRCGVRFNMRLQVCQGAARRWRATAFDAFAPASLPSTWKTDAPVQGRPI